MKPSLLPANALLTHDLKIDPANRLTILVFVCVFLISCSNKVPEELKQMDIVVGEGSQATKGSTITVHYTGWLFKNGRRGKKFDSSLSDGQPFTFRLGTGEVIQGWDLGIEGMRVGGRRELIIPPKLGYGDRGSPPLIPPDSILDFEIQLLEVQH